MPRSLYLQISALYALSLSRFYTWSRLPFRWPGKSVSSVRPRALPERAPAVRESKTPNGFLGLAEFDKFENGETTTVG